MDIDLRALRCFVAVADADTVTAAAADLRIGQPAVTRQIQHLERALRIRLFERQSGRLRLTAAGHDLLHAARATLHQADEVLTTAARVAQGSLQRVHIVSTGTTRDDVLAPWLATWPGNAPMPSVDDAPADDIYPHLRRGADLAVCPLPPPAGLASRLVAELPLWAYVAPGHEWAAQDSITLEKLATVPLLLLDTTFHARRTFDAALHRADLSVQALAEFGSPVVTQAVAASGRGVAVLTDDPRFGLIPLRIMSDDGPVSIRLHAAWEPSHHAAKALARLAGELQQFTAERYG